MARLAQVHAHQPLLRKPGQSCRGRVGRHHAPMRVGNDHTLRDAGQRLGGRAYFALVFRACRHVMNDGLADHPPVERNDVALDFDWPGASIAIAQLIVTPQSLMRSFTGEQACIVAAAQLLRVEPCPCSGCRVGIDDAATRFIHHDDGIRRAIEQPAVALLVTADGSEYPVGDPPPHQKRGEYEKRDARGRHPREHHRTGGKGHGEFVGRTLHGLVDFADAVELAGDLRRVNVVCRILTMQVGSDLAKFGHVGVARMPLLQRGRHVRRVRKMAEHENDVRDRHGQHVRAVQRGDDMVVIEMPGDHLVTRRVVGRHHREVALEIGVVGLVAAARISQQIEGRAILGLRPHALAIEYPGECGLTLQGSPQEKQDHRHDGGKRIPKRQQPLELGVRSELGQVPAHGLGCIS